MLHFLIPDPQSFRSGGNHYNERLLSAMKALGIPFTTTHQSRELPGQGLVLVDTLLWGQPLPPGCQPWLIVHHLQSLYPPPGYSSDAWFEAEERQQLHQFAGFLVSSPFTAAYLRQRGLEQPCVVVEPALDERPGPLPLRDYTSVDAIMTANLVPRKGILPFLQQLEQNGVPAGLRLRIFGESQLQPDYARACLQQLQRLPGDIRYGGVLPHSGLMRQYRQANLFISTSYMETYGMSIQEAAAYGLPLLLLRGGNTANHLRRPPNGQACDTPGELVSFLTRWAQRPGELLPLAENARQQAEAAQRSWRDAARELQQGLQPYLDTN